MNFPWKERYATVAVTGHRPDKICRQKYPTTQTQELFLRFVKDRLARWNRAMQPGESRQLCYITGMALGFDLAIASACHQLGYPYIAAVPFDGQHARWPAPDRRSYAYLLTHATYLHRVESPPYAPWKMLRRNIWMLEQASVKNLICVYNGTKGGTHHCVEASLRHGFVQTNWWEAWQEVLSTGNPGVEIHE